MLAEAAARYASGGVFGIDGGAKNASVIGLAGDFVAPRALFRGLQLIFKSAGGNDSTMTANGLGLGIKHVLNHLGAELSGGETIAGRIVVLFWDPTATVGGIDNVGAWILAPWTNWLVLTGGGSTTINNYSANIPYIVDTGTLNAVIGVFSPALVSFPAGTAVLVKIANTNTLASTLKVNALSAVPIVRRDGSSLEPGDLIANEVALFVSDGTNAQLLTSYSEGIIDVSSWVGVELAYVSSTTLTVKARTVWSDDGTTKITLPTNTTLNAGGVGANGLDAGSLTASTMYDVYLIKNPTTGAVATLATSASSPTLPSGYTKKRYGASFKTNSSGQIEPFDQYGRRFTYRNVQQELKYTATNIDGGLTPHTANFTVSVPKYRRVMAQMWLKCRLDMYHPSEGTVGLAATECTGPFTGLSNYVWEMSSNGRSGLSWWSGQTVQYPSCEMNVLSDTSGQIKVYDFIYGDSQNISIQTLGWEYL
jgi:hypothetical protein